MSEDPVSDLASAVLDATPIDWSAAESRVDDASRPVLAQLKVLAALVDVHRRLHAHEEADESRSGDGADTLTHWGHLRALERIGRGAYGEVYRAWDTRLDREVALKLLDVDPGATENPWSSIIKEGQLLARVRHPNVVTIYGAEQIGARVGLWMEFVRGRTLKQIVDAGKVFTGPEAVQIGIALCQAVAAVHAAGVLHRDIKAQNVTLADDGRPVLMDFGTGRELADNATSDLAGTPLYAAPEVLGGGDATIQSDLYSLGVLLYFLVAASYPVGGGSLAEVRLAHQRHQRTGLRNARGRSRLSSRFMRIVQKTIDPVPDRRHASAEALAADLEALGRPLLKRATYAVGVSAVVLLLAGVGWEVLGQRWGASRTPSTLLGSSRIQRRYGTDLQKYDMYLRGRALADRRSVPSSEGAIKIFETILKADPAYAPAHAGIANAYAYLALPRGLAFKTAYSRMRLEAVKAIELDPELAEAHAAMGWVSAFVFDWKNAATSFERAIDLDPDLTQTSTSYAIAVLEPLEKFDEALQILGVARRRDPVSLDVQREIGQAQMFAGRYEEALVTLQRVRAVDSTFAVVDVLVARTLMYAGRPAEALPLMEKQDSRAVGVPGNDRRNPWLAQAYVMTGRRAEAETLVREHQADASRVAIIYAALGDKDHAFEALDRAALSEPHRVPRTLIQPEMAALRGDRRLAALRVRFHLPPQ
jgi:tetratricopeptide (TPR) repeat protein